MSRLCINVLFSIFILKTTILLSDLRYKKTSLKGLRSVTPNHYFQLFQNLASPSFPNLLPSLACASLPNYITWWNCPEMVKVLVNARRLPPCSNCYSPSGTLLLHKLGHKAWQPQSASSHDSEMKRSLCEFLPVHRQGPAFSHRRCLSSSYLSSKYSVLDMQGAPCSDDFPNRQEVSTNAQVTHTATSVMSTPWESLHCHLDFPISPLLHSL